MKSRLCLFAALLAITLTLSVNHQTLAANHYGTINDAVKTQLLGKTLRIVNSGEKGLSLQYTINNRFKLDAYVYDFKGKQIVVFADQSFKMSGAFLITSNYQYGFGSFGQLFIARLAPQARKERIPQGKFLDLLFSSGAKKFIKQEYLMDFFKQKYNSTIDDNFGLLATPMASF